MNETERSGAVPFVTASEKKMARTCSERERVPTARATAVSPGTTNKTITLPNNCVLKRRGCKSIRVSGPCTFYLVCLFSK